MAGSGGRSARLPTTARPPAPAAARIAPPRAAPSRTPGAARALRPRPRRRAPAGWPRAPRRAARRPRPRAPRAPRCATPAPAPRARACVDMVGACMRRAQAISRHVSNPCGVSAWGARAIFQKTKNKCACGGARAACLPCRRRRRVGRLLRRRRAREREASRGRARCRAPVPRTRCVTRRCTRCTRVPRSGDAVCTPVWGLGCAVCAGVLADAPGAAAGRAGGAPRRLGRSARPRAPRARSSRTPRGGSARGLVPAHKGAHKDTPVYQHPQHAPPPDEPQGRSSEG